LENIFLLFKKTDKIFGKSIICGELIFWMTEASKAVY